VRIDVCRPICVCFYGGLYQSELRDDMVACVRLLSSGCGLNWLCRGFGGSSVLSMYIFSGSAVKSITNSNGIRVEARVKRRLGEGGGGGGGRIGGGSFLRKIVTATGRNWKMDGNGAED